jgi:hypothetical protein
MPGVPPTSPAPLRVADTLELPGVECVTKAEGRCGGEIPARSGKWGQDLARR